MNKKKENYWLQFKMEKPFHTSKRKKKKKNRKYK